MEFRQIDAKLENPKAIYRLAKWHNETPSLWIENYQASEEDIQETISRMQSKKNYIAVAEEEEIKAFIWAEVDDHEVMILSLYVEPNVRQQHLGTYLKEALETWCKITGISKIKTTVHSKNSKMIALNEKLGYQAKMIHMEKLIE